MVTFLFVLTVSLVIAVILLFIVQEQRDEDKKN